MVQDALELNRMLSHFRLIPICPTNRNKAIFARVCLGDRFLLPASLVSQVTGTARAGRLCCYHKDIYHKNQNNNANRLQRNRSKSKVQQMRERMKPSDPGCDSPMQLKQRQRQGEEWDSLWKDGITPWDLGRPTPALISEIDYKMRLEQGQQQFERATNFRNCLVPGCGSGYDLVALAQYFHRLNSSKSLSLQNEQQECQHVIVGLEISPKSLERAQQIVEEAKTKESIDKSCRIKLFHGDFFESPKTWTQFPTSDTGRPSDVTNQSNTPPMKYDFIFDYLFFCAIPPALRNDWGLQMSILLTQRGDDEDIGDNINTTRRGKLLTLMFPYHHHGQQQQLDEQASSKLIGPPYRVNVEDYKQALEPNGFKLQPGRIFGNEGEIDKSLVGSSPYPTPETVPERQGQELVGWWQTA